MGLNFAMRVVRSGTWRICLDTGNLSQISPDPLFQGKGGKASGGTAHGSVKEPETDQSEGKLLRSSKTRGTTGTVSKPRSPANPVTLQDLRQCVLVDECTVLPLWLERRRIVGVPERLRQQSSQTYPRGTFPSASPSFLCWGNAATGSSDPNSPWRRGFRVSDSCRSSGQIKRACLFPFRVTILSTNTVSLPS